jgi:hypothetical protein
MHPLGTHILSGRQTKRTLYHYHRIGTTDCVRSVEIRKPWMRLILVPLLNRGCPSCSGPVRSLGGVTGPILVCRPHEYGESTGDARKALDPLLQGGDVARERGSDIVTESHVREARERVQTDQVIG